MDSYWPLIIFLSLISSAFSSGMEIAFITANKLKIELDKKQGVFASGIIGHFTRHPKMFIATMLVGNNIALVVYGLYMGEVIESSLAHTFPTLEPAIGNFGVVFIQTIISTIIVLVFAEFIPKALFSINPNRWLNVFAIPTAIWYVALYIFAWIVTGISDFILRFFFRKEVKPEEVEFGRIDLDNYLEQATGNIDHSKDIDHEIQIFQNALDFSNVKARDCLIPRNEIVAIEITDSIENLKNLFISTRLSKILVFRENIDHIIGYVHSFELFKKPQQIQHILRPVSIIPEPMPANEILELFIREKKSVSVVVDEFGGTAGIITMEDIVEEIFGEIEDEHDKEETSEKVIGNGVFEFSARLEIDYLNEKYNLGLPVNDEQYDTLGGLILFLYGDIPEENEIITYQQFVLTPLQVGETRIELVRIEIKD
ncbi:MAG: hemolysin family protein [Flavobacteriales bacterium]|nr:hemolysin family protein [Flavobacteriales bacterium]